MTLWPANSSRRAGGCGAQVETGGGLPAPPDTAPEPHAVSSIERPQQILNTLAIDMREAQEPRAIQWEVARVVVGQRLAQRGTRPLTVGPEIQDAEDRLTRSLRGGGVAVGGDGDVPQVPARVDEGAQVSAGRTDEQCDVAGAGLVESGAVDELEVALDLDQLLVRRE
jgi:hypothetical protein